MSKLPVPVLDQIRNLADFVSASEVPRKQLARIVTLLELQTWMIRDVADHHLKRG